MIEVSTDQIGLFINLYAPNSSEMVLYVIQCSVLVAGIFLNMTVVLLVLCINRLRSVQGIGYVFNLSCANSVFNVATLLTSSISKSGVFKDKFLCSLATALTNYLCITASLSRLVIATDRYKYIDDPLHYYSRSSETTIIRIILLLWLGGGFLAFTPYVIFFSGTHTDSHCLPNPAYLYEICIVLVSVLFPMGYEIFVYTRIFYWAYMHIQIMKQEANYTNQLRQRSIKESYNVDIRQLELFTRASLLMASTIFAIKADDEMSSDRSKERHDSGSASSAWGQALRRLTINSSVVNYITSIVTFGLVRRSRDSDPDREEVTVRTTFTSFGSAIDRADSRERCSDEPCERVSVVETPSVSLNPEDIYIEEELRRLSRKVEAKGFKSGSQALYGAISKMLTCTEMKVALILFVVLGSLVGCWVPFIMLFLGRIVGHKEESGTIYYRKIANIIIYFLSCVDPIIYDLLHQPIRNAVKEEIKHSLKHRNCMS